MTVLCDPYPMEPGAKQPKPNNKLPTCKRRSKIRKTLGNTFAGRIRQSDSGHKKRLAPKTGARRWCKWTTDGADLISHSRQERFLTCSFLDDGRFSALNKEACNITRSSAHTALASSLGLNRAKKRPIRICNVRVPQQSISTSNGEPVRLGR